MLTLVSRLSLLLIGIVAAASVAPRAAGLYEDPFPHLIRPDTVRLAVRMSQTEVEREDFRGSVLSIGARFRRSSRAHFECAVQFPAIRRAGEIAYGLGDGFVAGSYRVAGDTLETSALLLRGEARLPTGARGLVPFCRSSLEGGAGIEARAAAGNVSMRGSALYTLVGVREREVDFVNEHHVTIAATLAINVPRFGSAAASVSWTRFRGGGSQETVAVGFDRALSGPVVIGAALAVQSADGPDEIYDWLVGLSISYRFPPRSPARPASPGESPEAPPSAGAVAVP